MSERLEPLSDAERTEIRTLEGIRTDREVADEFLVSCAEVRAIWNADDDSLDLSSIWDDYTGDYS
jgi:hypothetical protein